MLFDIFLDTVLLLAIRAYLRSKKRRSTCMLYSVD
jgi:hypothetical protein